MAELVKDLVRFRDQVAQLRGLFMENGLPDGADGQVRRVADRFSLVAAAGEIATALKLTGWPAGAANDAAQRCFRDWMQERGGIGSSEVAEARRRIAEALQLHGSSRFQRWAKSSSDRNTVVNRMGFVKIEGNADEEEIENTYFFMAEPLKDLLSGLDFRTVRSVLMDEGVIVAQNGKPTKPYHVPVLGKKERLYEISTEAIDNIAGEDDA